MKATIRDIGERVPDVYQAWPLHFKRMLASLLDYYMVHDNRKFAELWRMINRWSEEEDREERSLTFKLSEV